MPDPSDRPELEFPDGLRPVEPELIIEAIDVLMDTNGVKIMESLRKRGNVLADCEYNKIGRPFLAHPRAVEIAKKLHAGQGDARAKGAFIVALESTVQQSTQITLDAGGAGFGAPARRAKVEAAAMKSVEQHFASSGWSVKDVSKEFLGWDLTCTREDQVA